MGIGVQQDFVESVKWYRKAADQGHAGAQVSVGARYEYGDGVPQDYEMAARWYFSVAPLRNVGIWRDVRFCAFYDRFTPESSRKL